MTCGALLACVAWGLAACAPGPVAPSAGAWPGDTFAAGFGALSPEMVRLIGRPPGQGPRSLAATGVRLGWAAPADHQGGNWAFDVVVGGPPGVGGAAPGASAGLQARALPPAEGGFEAALEVQVLPGVASWAADARRVDGGGPGDGGPAVFVSEARRETLSVYLGPEGGVALRTAWAKAPEVSEAPVGAAQALAAIEAALKTPGAGCEEATTGVDHFTGVPYTNPEGLPAGCLAIRAREGATPRVEADSGRRLAAPLLVRHLGRLAWRIEEAAPAHCKAGPTLDAIYEVGHGPGFLRVQGAGGWVDATTGRVIRWRRSYRVYDVEGV